MSSAESDDNHESKSSKAISSSAASSHPAEPAPNRTTNAPEVNPVEVNPSKGHEETGHGQEEGQETSRIQVADVSNNMNEKLVEQDGHKTSGAGMVGETIKDQDGDKSISVEESLNQDDPKSDSDAVKETGGPSSQVTVDMPLRSAGKSKESTTTPSGDGEQDWNEKESYEAQGGSANSPMAEQEFDERVRQEDTTDSKGEIEHIIEQFGEKQGHMSPQATTSSQSSDIQPFQYPPRVSSLEQRSSKDGPTDASKGQNPPTPSKQADPSAAGYAASISSQPPQPDPDPDLPFDFHRFLEQLRHRTADPVAKFLRSFLLEFSKKQWQVHEQVKIITDFLTFISGKMAQCEVWRSVSDAEFDNAREGMEKLVMNRLYVQTFSPEIPPVDPARNKGRRSATPVGPGRKGQHQEDVERDEVLAQKVRIYGWIREEHLDIRPFGDKGKKFLTLAQQELSKIKSYRAPRDKVICVLNCCKVIFGYLRNAHSDQSADAFIPLLIYTVLKANPDHLVSNVQYILRFRNQDKLGGEAGYYMSSLLGAVQFIETLDRTNLTITDEEFEQNVEAAVSTIAEPHRQDEKAHPPSQSANRYLSGKSSLSRPEVTARDSSEGVQSSARRAVSRSRETPSGDDSDDNAAMAGLLRTIQKPLSTIGRIFSDDTSAAQQQSSLRPSSDAQSSSLRPPRTSSRAPPNPSLSVDGTSPTSRRASSTSPSRLAKDVSAAQRASVETETVRQVTQAEHKTVVETLAGMFPDLDPDIISDVVRVKQGRIGQAVDACLALSR